MANTTRRAILKRGNMTEVEQKYNEFWKEIVENPDGTLNKDQIMKELADFSVLIHNLSTIYCYMTGNMVSKPMVDSSVIIQLCEEQLQEAHNRGYQEALDNHVGPGSDDE
jgi:hypothetical protein